MPPKNLVYDIGAHHGDDTAYFLQMGYRVVGVEANPVLVKQLQQRFDGALKNGDLTILNIAIADTPQQSIPFYISRDDWRSSVIKDIAERETSILDMVEVPAHTLGSLFTKYGTPYYCKIDIEGNDEKAIKSIMTQSNRPAYISCEISCHSIAAIHQHTELLFDTLNALQEAGYRQFQLIDQDNLVQLEESGHYARLYQWPVRFFTKIERLTGLFSPKYNNRLYLARQRKTDPEYVTAPFGEALTGNWYDYATTKKYIHYHFHDYYKHANNKDLIFWVDIHAKR